MSEITDFITTVLPRSTNPNTTQALYNGLEGFERSPTPTVVVTSSGGETSGVLTGVFVGDRIFQKCPEKAVLTSLGRTTADNVGIILDGKRVPLSDIVKLTDKTFHTSKQNPQHMASIGNTATQFGEMSSELRKKIEGIVSAHKNRQHS